VGKSLRSLQRNLRKYVRIGPKALLRRFRLQEAAARLAERRAVEQAALAHALGYCDQAHFIRDFRALVGEPPGAYAEALGRARQDRRP
jgi:AraC-like DNA-binding protein